MKRPLAALITIVTLVAATVALSQSFVIPLGSSRGPQQPIAFSHKIHAGKLGMDCLYCHYSADKSSIANIPPVSQCMGCHTIAMADRPEIKKLAAYWEKKELPPWAEVYRLPDHVKFNHKRHVKAGVACQTCHGKVEEMDVVYQFPSMKMGWCLECHRKELTNKTFPATMDCVACHH